MDRQRRATQQVSDASAPGTSFEAESESSLLHEARGWAGSAREARARIEVDRAAELLQTQRRNGPGQ